MAKRALMLKALADAALLDRAYAWLRHRRQNYPADSDIWDFRRGWPEEKARIQTDLREHRFRFGLLTRLTRADGTAIDVWAARDALVLKALAWLLGAHLPLSRHCTHLKDHGGAKGALRAVLAALPANHFVLKTDVRAYYDSIDHGRLLDRLARFVPDRGLLNLIGQYLRRTAEGGGLYWSYKRGLSLGCPLSPIMAAFFLREVDEQLTAMGPFYIRFMDDIVVLTPTRWALQRAVTRLNQTFAALALQKHPDKTFIGRIEKGFDFLGYRLWPDRIAVAEATAERFRARLTQVYEQERGCRYAETPLGSYVRRWLSWARGGLPSPVAMPAAPPT